MGMGREESPAMAVSAVGMPWLHAVAWWSFTCPHVQRELSITIPTSHNGWLSVQSSLLCI